METKIILQNDIIIDSVVTLRIRKLEKIMIDIDSTICQDEANGAIDMTPVYNNIPLYSSLSGWNYAMRRSMQEIIPGLFLGPYSAAQKQCHKHLVEAGISHIICVRQDIEAHFIRPQFTDTFTYLTLDIADNATENIIRFFPQAKKFIDDALRSNQKVLVHGNTGTSRSASLVLAYIMEKFGLSSMDAYKYVKAKRNCIHPNVGFVAQLTEYEPIYKARRTLEKGETSCGSRKLKRKAEYLETSDFDLIQPPPSPVYFSNEERCETNEELSDTVCRLLSKHAS